jgi:hypothetical protein
LNLDGRLGTVSGMTAPESRRHEMYAGLARVIGQQEADRLMAYLPRQESSAIATRADLVGVETRLAVRIDHLERRIDQVDGRIDGVNQRLDRLFLTMGAGFLAVVGTLVAGTLWG